MRTLKEKRCCCGLHRFTFDGPSFRREDLYRGGVHKKDECYFKLQHSEGMVKIRRKEV